MTEMINRRREVFNEISRLWAITRYDIEHHQAINDLSLNIHGENFFRDLFNDLYDLNMKNSNFESANSPCIDLIDDSKKLAYQITTTRTIDKIEKTLKALKKNQFNEFNIKIFYLLNKAKLNKITKKKIESLFNINLSNILFDYNDIIRDINNLETEKLFFIHNKYFKNISEKYTNHIVLDLAVKHLIKQAKQIKKDYNDEFGTIQVKKKIKLNGINSRNSAHITIGQDYRSLIEELKEDNSLSDLRNYIVDEVYKGILKESIEEKQILESNVKYTTLNFQEEAVRLDIDFNKLIKKLYEQIKNELKIDDFNSINIPWIIIGYFFEICDVGVHK